MKYGQNGFAPVIIVLAVIAVLVMSGVGAWYYVQTIKPNPVPTAGQELTQPNSAEQINDDDISNWQTYRNETCRFSVRYPANLSIKQTYNNPNPETESTNKTTNGDKIDTFFADYGVGSIICNYVDFVLGNLALEDYLSTRIEQNANIFKDAGIKTIIIGNIQGYEIKNTDGSKTIYFQDGDILVRFDSNSKNSDAGSKIFDQILSTVNFDPRMDSLGELTFKIDQYGFQFNGSKNFYHFTQTKPSLNWLDCDVAAFSSKCPCENEITGKYTNNVKISWINSNGRDYCHCQGNDAQGMGKYTLSHEYVTLVDNRCLLLSFAFMETNCSLYDLDSLGYKQCEKRKQEDDVMPGQIEKTFSLIEPSQK